MQLKKEFIKLSNHFNKNINEDYYWQLCDMINVKKGNG